MPRRPVALKKMPMTRAPWIRFLFPLLMCWLLGLSLASRAMAEDAEAVNKVTRLNKKAIEEYENLNFEEARKILKEALDLCSSAGLDKHPVKARTHVHLGIVILTGFKQREVALKQFRRALDIQPDIKLTKILANPEIQQAFDEAVAGAGSDKGEAGPSDLPGGGIAHQPIATASQGNAVSVKVTLEQPGDGDKVMLFYRTGGASDFLSVEMTAGGGNSYNAEIPASATLGNQVQYYVEVQGADGAAKGTKGVASDPITVALKGAGADEEVTKDDDDDGARRGPGGRLFLGLMLGSGIGWTTGKGEVNVEHDVDPPGFAPSQLGHLAPEIGFFVRPNLLLSIQGRFQLVSGATPEADPTVLAPGEPSQCGPDKICQPAGEKLRPFVSFSLGGGYIRHVAEFKSARACGDKPEVPMTCVDTVPAGPVLVGPGGGIIYNLTNNFGLIAGLNVPIGFPKFTFHVDLNAGVSLRI
jgi:hypothetical protein